MMSGSESPPTISTQQGNSTRTETVAGQICERVRSQMTAVRKCSVFLTGLTVAVILRNIHRNEIYQSSVYDKMRLEFGGRTIVAKDTLFMVKFVEKIEEPASDVVAMQ